ncbi:hypothetical protein Pmani_001263 [Petrolisthes manimaculis]|uniref:Uncharacterized protein n=1 Tax=Petrolisthes manimaculis TaxID=1843537 RepID=A0AAE1QL44_9EUCA|nr:hypothetical protein Pmani_001263 [Petrolisthes manimaculis]
MHICTSSVVVPPPPHLTIGPHPLQVIHSFKLLGITLDDQLSWKQHVARMVKEASYKLYVLHRLKSLGTPAGDLKHNNNSSRRFRRGYAESYSALPILVTMMPHHPESAQADSHI